MPNIFNRTMLVLMALLCTGLVMAQSAREQIAANIDKAGGVYYQYDFHTPPPTPAPRGYEAFYISHYGRHGARYILEDREYDSVVEVFNKARADGKLTPKGLEACDRFLSIYPLLKNRAGELTPKGQQQHKLLAQRMYGAYPSIFDSAPRIEAYSTIVPRCIVSMSAFCEGLKELNPRLNIFKEVSRVNMPYLNPHSPYNPSITEQDHAYRSPQAPWRAEFRNFCEQTIDTPAFLRRLFSDTTYAANICDPIRFEQDLFTVAVHMQCTDLGESFFDLFTHDELFRLWECNNYVYYIEKGPDPRNQGRMWALSHTLLEDLLDGAEQDIAAGSPTVRLRFGHDGCMMALLCLMQIDGWSTPVTDPRQIKEVWRSFDIPMASNIQLVFYRSPENPDILVRMMLNERELNLPFPTKQAPYYNWDDFRKFYTQVNKQAVIKLQLSR